MLKITEFAKLCGCSVHTLRYYDEIDLFKPCKINNESRYRYYDKSQVEKFLEIKEFQDIGFDIQEIKSFQEKSNDEIANIITYKINDMELILKKAYIIRKKYIENNHNRDQFINE